MAIVIEYELSEAGQKANLLASGNGAKRQSATVPSDHARYAEALAMVSLNANGEGRINMRGRSRFLPDGLETRAVDPSPPIDYDEAPSIERLLDDEKARRAELAVWLALRKEEDQARESERRAAAERLAAGPISEQVDQLHDSRWRVLPALDSYADLSGRARAEVARLNAADEQAHRSRQEARDAEKKRRARVRAATLMSAVDRYLPDLPEAWRAGELAERSVVQAIYDRLETLAQLPSEPPAPWTAVDVKALPAGPLRAWLKARPQILAAYAILGAELGAAVGPPEYSPGRLTMYRRADMGGPDDVELAHKDGDVPTGQELYRVWTGCEVGGLLLDVTWYCPAEEDTGKTAAPPASPA